MLRPHFLWLHFSCGSSSLRTAPTLQRASTKQVRCPFHSPSLPCPGYSFFTCLGPLSYSLSSWQFSFFPSCGKHRSGGFQCDLFMCLLADYLRNRPSDMASVSFRHFDSRHEFTASSVPAREGTSNVQNVYPPETPPSLSLSLSPPPSTDSMSSFSSLLPLFYLPIYPPSLPSIHSPQIW